MYRIFKIILLGIILQIIAAQFMEKEKLITVTTSTIKRRKPEVANETLKKEDAGLNKIISKYINLKEKLLNLKFKEALRDLEGIVGTVILFADSLETLRNYQHFLELELCKIVEPKQLNGS